MAQHFLNNLDTKIITNGSLQTLLDELIKNYEFQTILFLNFDKQDIDYILESRVEFKSLFYCENDFDFENETYEQVDCVVATDNCNIKSIRKFATTNFLPFILYQKSYVQLDNFSKYFLSLSESFELNNLTKIVVNKDVVNNNFSDFLSCFSLDLNYLIFNIIENDLNELFFSINQVNLKNKINYLIDNFIKLYENTEFSYENVMDIYSNFVNFICSFNINFLSFYNALNYEKNVLKNTYKNAILIEIIFSIYNLFFKKSTINLNNFVNLKNRQNDIKLISCIDNLKSFDRKFNQSEFYFVKSRFSLSLINKISYELSRVEKLKQIACSFNIKKIFNLTKELNLSKMKNNLFYYIENYREDSILKVIDYYGYLDYKRA